MGWYKYTTSRVIDGETVAGVFLPAVIHNHLHYLTLIGVYKNSLIDCWGLCTFAEFLQKIETEWVVNTVPVGDTLGIHHFARFRIAEWHASGTMNDLVKNVRCAIDELNGRPTAQERVIHAMKAYREQETEEHFQTLRTAFEDMPSFYRIYTFGSRFERHHEIQKRLGLTPPPPETWPE